MNDNLTILLGGILTIVFLLAFQASCIEFSLNNDAYYLEKFRIEEGLYNNE